MSAIVKCPNCNKDVELAVINIGEPSEVIPTKATTPPPPPPKPTDSKVTIITTVEASKLKSGVSVQGTIERKGESRTITLKDGSSLDVCDAFLCDQSGEIKVTFWGEDVNKVNDGNQIRIENGFTNTFKGEVSLTKGKYGKLIIL